MPTQVDLIPEDAPFEQGQRQWLNGLISALAGWEGALGGADQGGGHQGGGRRAPTGWPAIPCSGLASVPPQAWRR